MLPDGSALLDLCDAMRHAAPARRDLAVLAACGGAADEADAAALDVGTFAARLLDACEARWGPQIPGQAACPSCGEACELRLDAAQLRQPAGAGPGAVLRVEADGAAVLFRLPSAGDLAGLVALDATEARRELLLRCLLPPDAPPPEDSVLDRGAGAMEAAAPQADVAVAARCPRCGAGFEAALDAGTLLWEALAQRAERLADEVHLLASAYGWSEAEVLGLSPARRLGYLRRVAA